MLITAFYSDPHFGHTNILKYCDRPFASLHEMEEALITRYNAQVGPNDTVLWCGDATHGGFSKLPWILSRLNGHKILVKGNHDKSKGSMARSGFDLVMDTCVLNIAGRTCVVSHFPYIDMSKDPRYPELRPKRVKGEVLIHGHTHSKNRRQGNAIHVGVDAWDYRPARFEEVEALVQEISQHQAGDKTST